MKRTAIIWIAIAGAMLGTSADAAEAYPAKPVRMIVPYAPGGNADLVGRLVADGLTARLGAQFIVDNRPGASSVIGTEVSSALRIGLSSMLLDVPPRPRKPKCFSDHRASAKRLLVSTPL